MGVIMLISFEFTKATDDIGFGNILPHIPAHIS